MASFRKRGDYQWQARVNIKSYPSETKTFNTRTEAEVWARNVESQMDKGSFVSRVEADNTTLKEVLDRYLREVRLYISATRGKSSLGIDEPALFSEPGIFLVRPDRTLYFGSVQTSPFARPRFEDLLSLIDFAIDRNFPPARGEYSGEV
jgi:hypothetical protein